MTEAFNCETGVDPQHLRGFGPGLLRLSRLGIGAGIPSLMASHALVSLTGDIRLRYL